MDVPCSSEGELLIAKSGTLIDLNTQSLTDAVAVANVALAPDGLQVRETPGRGYGLFTTRPFAKGKEVTGYGGVYYKPCKKWRGDYVLSVPARQCAWDTQRYFYAHDGGRWINEPPFGQMWRVNLEGRYTGKRYYFVAARDLEAGEELFLNYGDDYEAPWRLENILARRDRAEMERALLWAQQMLANVKAVAPRMERSRANFELRHATEDVAALRNALMRLGCVLCQRPARTEEAFAGPKSSVRLFFCSAECQHFFYNPLHLKTAAGEDCQ